MTPIFSLPVGIIAARTIIGSAWQSHEWWPANVFFGIVPLSAGSLVKEVGGIELYFAGTSTLTLHKSEAASYRANIEQVQPCLYVVLKPAGSVDEPPSVHLVTVAPDEAEAYLEGDEWLIGSVPMPSSLRDSVATFVDEYFVAPQPRKGPRAPNRSSAIGPKSGGFIQISNF